MYFGLKIKKRDNLDIQNIAARLFLCPRISPEHASRILEMLVEKRLSVNYFERKTNEYMSELKKLKETDNEKVWSMMNSKLDAWSKVFNPPDPKDYKYLERQFGLTFRDLFGPSSITEECNNHRVESPKEMASYVKQFIKGQDAAIDKLAVPFFLHLESKRKQYTSKVKTPVLLIGPTGSGKSETLRLFGKLCDCPVIRINSSQVVPSSWKGQSIKDILAQEINAKTSIDDLKYAVVVFHEFDKITHYGHKAVGNKGSDFDTDMVRELMAFFETDYCLNLEKGINPDSMMSKTYKLPVDNLFLIFDGSFYGMEEIVRKRLNISSIGFNKMKDKTYEGINIQSLMTSDDLIQWGILPELVGRIGDIVVMDPLSTDVIYEIMTSAKDNILQSHIDYFSRHNIQLSFSDDALHYIAEMAEKSGLGFRNVKAILAKSLNRLYYEMLEPSLKKERIVIGKDYIMQNIF